MAGSWHIFPPQVSNSQPTGWLTSPGKSPKQLQESLIGNSWRCRQLHMVSFHLYRLVNITYWQHTHCLNNWYNLKYLMSHSEFFLIQRRNIRGQCLISARTYRNTVPVKKHCSKQKNTLNVYLQRLKLISFVINVGSQGSQLTGIKAVAQCTDAHTHSCFAHK